MNAIMIERTIAIARAYDCSRIIITADIAAITAIASRNMVHCS